jgi:hypothetical protein
MYMDVPELIYQSSVGLIIKGRKMSGTKVKLRTSGIFLIFREYICIVELSLQITNGCFTFLNLFFLYILIGFIIIFIYIFFNVFLPLS